MKTWMKVLIGLGVLAVLALIVVGSLHQRTPVHSISTPVRATTSANQDAATGGVMLVIFGVLGLLSYFIPSFVAKGRNRADAIFMLNLLLGWTLLGWVGALIWAMCEKPRVAAAASTQGTLAHSS
jgi:hypothetical protein